MSYRTFVNYKRHQLRLYVADDLASLTGLNYEWVLAKLEYWQAFGNWSLDEIKHRPVNLEELADLLAEEV